MTELPLIAIVDDDRWIRRSLERLLKSAGFRAETFVSAEDYLAAGKHEETGCIILDIGLPGGSGLTILEELKRNDKADGLLIISAKDSLDDKVHALRAGADDYLTKPFHLSELGARVAAIIRRKSFDGKNILVFDDLEMDLNERTVSVRKTNVELTKKEFDLLLYFISNKNRVITKTAIAEHLWDDHLGVSSNYDFLYTHIKNLRKKLMQAGTPDYIQSIYGMGYKFSVAR